MHRQAILDEIWGSATSRFNDVGFLELTPSEQTAICLTEIYVEVQTGAFHQYYSNSSGDHAQDAPPLLDRIGANELAGIIRRCNEVFGPEGPPRRRETRMTAVDSLEEWQAAQLDSLADEFFDLPYDAQVRFEEFALRHLDEFPGIANS